MSRIDVIVEGMPEDANKIDYVISAKKEKLQYELARILRRIPIKSWEKLGYHDVKAVEIKTYKHLTTHNILAWDWEDEWKVYISITIHCGEQDVIYTNADASIINWPLAEINESYNLFCRKVLQIRNQKFGDQKSAEDSIRLENCIQYEATEKKKKLNKRDLINIIKTYSDHSLYTRFFIAMDLQEELVEYCQRKAITDEIEIAKLKKKVVLELICNALKNIEEYCANEWILQLYIYWKGAEIDDSELYAFIDDYLNQKNTVKKIRNAAAELVTRSTKVLSRGEKYLFDLEFRDKFYKELIYKERQISYSYSSSVKLSWKIINYLKAYVIAATQFDETLINSEKPIMRYLYEKRDVIEKLRSHTLDENDYSIYEEIDAAGKIIGYRLKIGNFNIDKLYDSEDEAEIEKKFYFSEDIMYLVVTHILDMYMEEGDSLASEFKYNKPSDYQYDYPLLKPYCPKFKSRDD